MKINPIIEAVIFDFDDTLLATFEVRCNAFILAAAQFDYQISEVTVRENWGKPLPQFIFDVLPGVDVNAFEKYYIEYIKQHPSNLLPGAINILKTLDTRNVIMAIVSASSNQVLYHDMKRTEIDTYFSFVYGANDIKYHKPDPRSLYPAIDNFNKCGISRNNVIFIGDSVRDYLAANGNALQFFAVTTGLDSRKSFIKSGLNTRFIAENLLEIEKMLFE
jgi:phosphoglycolate phosphatase